MTRAFWNERYRQTGFVYGEEPNEYLRRILPGLTPGTILFPAEGEGRNAVFAAKLGWKVKAFDQSEVGQKKAALLAGRNGVEVDYAVADMKDVMYPLKSFDALAMIYAHFPEAGRRSWHRKLASFVKKGGKLVLEGFNKKQAENQQNNSKAGGPRDATMLYNLEELRSDFEGFEFEEADEQDIELEEGLFHVGKASVIRIFATKK